MKLKDWLILILPIVGLFLVMLFPFIPDQIPMQFNANGEATWHLTKWLFPIVGVIPFLIYYRLKKDK